eukprot:3307263-Prymnesium_polylepis.1
MAVAPPHASSEDRAALSRHGVGTEHTGRAEAGLHVLPPPVGAMERLLARRDQTIAPSDSRAAG